MSATRSAAARPARDGRAPDRGCPSHVVCPLLGHLRHCHKLR